VVAIQFSPPAAGNGEPTENRDGFDESRFAGSIFADEEGDWFLDGQVEIGYKGKIERVNGFDSQSCGNDADALQIWARLDTDFRMTGR